MVVLRLTSHKTPAGFKKPTCTNLTSTDQRGNCLFFLLKTSNVHLKICKKKKRKSQEEFQLSLENRPNCTCRISSVCVCMLVQKRYSKAIIFYKL